MSEKDIDSRTLEDAILASTKLIEDLRLPPKVR